MAICVVVYCGNLMQEYPVQPKATLLLNPSQNPRHPDPSSPIAMHYTERPPHPALASYIRCLWAFEASPDDGAAEIQRIVPDGYPEMVLQYGDDACEISANGVQMRQPRFIFAGQISQPLLLQPGVRAGLIGIRLQPAGARMFLGIPMHETTDVRLDVALVWAQQSEHLIDAVCSARDTTARLQLVEQFLRMKLTHSRNTADAAVTHGVRLLQSAAGQLSVDALANCCGLSSRQLERRFQSEVGIPPRLLASIFRFRRVFDLLEQPRTGSWVSAAIGAGYFDQAHMIRDFKRFAGLQPQAFHRSLNGLSAAMIGGETAL